MDVIFPRKGGKRKQTRNQDLPARPDTALSSGSNENLQHIPRAENQKVEQKLQSSTKEKAFVGQAINDDIHPQARWSDDWSHLKPDERGAELGREARVWKVYAGEADRWDREVVEGWGKSMDVLLGMAALFSAISASFLIESSSMLKQDPNDVSAERLLVSLRL
ncbi:hypothetical protein B0J17DRAFT_773142 [Rhizoctonia solani]|nr:hypothetical protein B0J17DRAFT_773142 [Rhizoctonia solani]